MLAARLGLRSLLRAPPRRVSLPERLENIPKTGLPLHAAVRIRWNENQIPFVEAEHDRDLAVALGIVHGHLRLAQVEMMRRLAQGRTAEILGPAAIEMDTMLRTLDFARAVPGIVASLPDETQTWLEGFVDGLNAVVERAPKLPFEFSLFGFRPEPWTVADVLTVGRIAAADFTWRVWVRLLRLRGRPDWVRLWQRLLRDEAAPVPAFAGSTGSDHRAIELLLGALGRSGSNSLAISARRSATGAALLSSDPHLSFVLPNLWFIVGCRSPSYHLVGMTIPGLPVIAFGRNPWIGWGGTSLHAASSELYEVTDLHERSSTVRRERLQVRWWPDTEVSVRDTEYGPILTDRPMLRAPDGRHVAMHWIGHTPSDEITAMLGVNRARNWDEFSRAIDGFAIPAQNMIYADARGHVGQAMAAKLPRRPLEPPADLFVAPETRRHWESFVSAKDLPAALDPEQGFAASANNRPAAGTVVPVGFFFSPDDRIRRIRSLLDGSEPVTLDRLKGLHQDVGMPSALGLRDALLALPRPGPGDATAERFLEVLAAWHGGYEIDSRGALAFELLVYHFARELHGDEALEIYSSSWDPWALLREDMAREEPAALTGAAERAIGRAAERWARYGAWGDMHRLRLGHLLGSMPILGRRYRLADVPVAGSNETLMKTAHGFSAERHAAKFGANARHISDFSDPDANYFVLLGGQDGWVGSTTFCDQFDPWRRGDYIQVPLSPEKVAELFPIETVLTP